MSGLFVLGKYLGAGSFVWLESDLNFRVFLGKLLNLVECFRLNVLG